MFDARKLIIDILDQVPGSEPTTDLIRDTIQRVFPHAARPETVAEACQTVVSELITMAAEGDIHVYNYLSGRIKSKGKTKMVVNGEDVTYRWSPYADSYRRT